MSLPNATPALSSWAVHNWIGESFSSSPGLLASSGKQLGKILEFPSEAKSRLGISVLEVCHFHLVQDPKQLERFRAAALRAGCRLHQLLIDEGDISHPTERFAHLEWIGGWIQAASIAGFERVRIIAGKQAPTPETIKTSIDSFKMLIDVARSLKVGVSTENWHELMSTPEAVNQVLDGLNGQLGLVVDFGNYGGPDKLANLSKIAPRATSSHAKCSFTGGEPDSEDFKACLKLLEQNNFKGVATLVHPEPGDEWAALETQRDLLLAS